MGGGSVSVAAGAPEIAADALGNSSLIANRPSLSKKPRWSITAALARLHQLHAIFAIFGASDRDKRLIFQGQGLLKRL